MSVHDDQIQELDDSDIVDTDSLVPMSYPYGGLVQLQQEPEAEQLTLDLPGFNSDNQCFVDPVQAFMEDSTADDLKDRDVQNDPSADTEAHSGVVQDDPERTPFYDRSYTFAQHERRLSLLVNLLREQLDTVCMELDLVRHDIVAKTMSKR